MKDFNLKDFIKNLNTDEFVAACGIPFGYKAMYPIFCEKCNKVLLIVPFRKLKKSNKAEVLGILPAEYIVKFEIHKAKVVPEKFKKFINDDNMIQIIPAGFEKLAYSEQFDTVPFGKVIGTFPTKEIAKLGKEEYKNKVEALYSVYDKILNAMLNGEAISPVDEMEFKQILGLLFEPEQTVIYRIICQEFFDKYLS